MADRGLDQRAATRPACLAVPDRRVKLITRGRVMAAGFTGSSRVARPLHGTMHIPTQDRGLVDKSLVEIVSELVAIFP